MNHKTSDRVASETLKLARSLDQVFKITFRIPVNNKSIKDQQQCTSSLKRPRDTSSHDNKPCNKIQRVGESSSTKQTSKISKTIVVTINNKISDLSYALVMDFESTCWQNMQFMKTPVEIIEFPGVLMNLDTGVIEDQFQQYVMPIEQPRLSDFCVKLTGITQAQVESGVLLKSAISRFITWLESVSVEKNLVPMDSPLPGKKYTVVTWSDWDLNVCLRQECLRKGLMIPPPLRKWVDLRAVYKQWYGRPTCGLKGSMEEVGLTFEGNEHSGLIDSQNTARLAFKMVSEGAQLTLSNVVTNI